MSGQIENQFIKNVLKTEAKYLNKFVKKSIDIKLSTRTSILKSSIETKSDKNTLTMNIRAYGRVLDINKKRRNIKVSKHFNIYDTNIFRTYYITADKLMHGLTEDVKLKIKKQFYK